MEIMNMLRDAHLKHLISDNYNMQLQSTISCGDTIPKSTEGQFSTKSTEGHYCL